MSDVYPDIRQWTIPFRGGPDSRVYEQRELTIDGEAQLIAIVGRSVGVLRANKFPFDRLGEVFPESGSLGDIRWDTAAELLGMAASAAPGIIAEAVACLFGIFPSDEYGKRNKDYADEVAFIRRHIHLADAVDILEVAAQQNDIKRLTSPFAKGRAMLATYGTPTSQPPEEPTPGA